MKNVKSLSADEYRELIRAVQSHPQLLRAVLLHSLSGQRCSALLPLPWKGNGVGKPRHVTRQRRKRGDV
jgi:hypothetical protein